MFVQGFVKVAAEMDPVKAKNIANSFNGALGGYSGGSGIRQGWANLKNAFSATPPPKAPTNVSPARPPMPNT